MRNRFAGQGFFSLCSFSQSILVARSVESLSREGAAVVVRISLGGAPAFVAVP